MLHGKVFGHKIFSKPQYSLPTRSVISGTKSKKINRKLEKVTFPLGSGLQQLVIGTSTNQLCVLLLNVFLVVA